LESDAEDLAQNAHSASGTIEVVAEVRPVDAKFADEVVKIFVHVAPD
jgi:hypothetical protein